MAVDAGIKNDEIGTNNNCGVSKIDLVTYIWIMEGIPRSQRSLV